MAAALVVAAGRAVPHRRRIRAPFQLHTTCLQIVTRSPSKPGVQVEVAEDLQVRLVVQVEVEDLLNQIFL